MDRRELNTNPVYPEKNHMSAVIQVKRGEKVKIAIAKEGNDVSSHFGRCPQFTIVDVEGNKLIKKETINNPGHRKDFLPQFFYDKGINCIIVGGLGHRASTIFKDKGIKVIVGVTGDIDKVIDDILKGTLESGESLCEPGKGKGYGIEKED